MSWPDFDLPTVHDVHAAAVRLQGVAHRTPVLRSARADALLGGQVFFKCENLQRSGSFKFRGAYNTLAQWTPKQRQLGALTYSAGNHGQALALAAQMLDIPALVLMPANASAVKLAATRGYGAEIITYHPVQDDREALALSLCAERGMTLVPPSDDADVIAGQGTAAMELIDQAQHLDVLLVPVGGGGLLAGSLLAAKAVLPMCRVYGVEPALANDGQQSLASGTRVTIAWPEATLADSARATSLAPMAFDIMQLGVEGIVTATDAQLIDTMRFFAERMKLVVEPSGALAFAGAVHTGAVHAGAVHTGATHAGLDLQGARVGIIVSGGNIDFQQYAGLLAD